MKILLLEDNAELVYLIRQTYKNESFVCFSHLNEALQWLQNNCAHLLIIDLGLPDSSGLDTLKAFKKFNTPKVVFTANSTLVKEVAAFGVDDFIAKNGDYHEMLERLNFNIEKHRPRRFVFAPEIFEEIKASFHAPQKLTHA